MVDAIASVDGKLQIGERKKGIVEASDG